MFLKFQELKAEPGDGHMHWKPLKRHTLEECETATFDSDEREVILFRKNGRHTTWNIPPEQYIQIFVLNERGDTIDTVNMAPSVEQQSA